MKTICTALLIFLNLAVFAQIPTDNLIFHLPLGGTAEDVSGNGNNGTLFGPIAAEDRFGNPNLALEFDGIDDYVTISAISDLSAVGDFSLSIWFKLASWEIQTGTTNGNIDLQYLFCGNAHSNTVSNNFFRDGFNAVLYYNTDGNSFLRNTTFDLDGDVYANTIDPDFEFINNWHHNVFVREGNKTFHYLDGVLISEEENDGVALNMNHNLYLGTFSGNNPNYINFNYNYHGAMDDIRMYGDALTAEEVNIIFTEASITATTELSAKNDLQIFPNPMTDMAWVKTTSPNQRLDIRDNLGRVIFTTIMEETTFEIQRAFVGAPGWYYVQILDRANTIIGHKKIIVN